MIIPSSTHGVIASSRPRVVVAGGGSDVTPDAVNFISVYYNNEFGEYGYTEKQITGINETIQLRVEFNNEFNTGSYTLYYSVSNESGFAVFGDNISYTSPSTYGMTPILNFESLYVQNNQYVTFGVTTNCGANAIVTVRNMSTLAVEGISIVLDTFNINHYGEC